MSDPAAPPTSHPGAPLTATDDKQWGMFAHLFSLIAWVITSGTLGWAPALVIYLVFKDRGRFTRDHSKETLNFYLTVLIASVALLVLTTILTLVTFGLFAFIGWVPFAALAVYVIVFGVIATMRTNRGESYRYPATVRLIR